MIEITPQTRVRHKPTGRVGRVLALHPDGYVEIQYDDNVLGNYNGESGVRSNEGAQLADLSDDLNVKRVVIFGPNLNSVGQRKGAMHVHAADCGDCKHYGPGTKYGGDRTTEQEMTLDVSTRRECVEAVYPPGEFDYDAETEWEQFDDLYVAPCVRLS